MVSFRSLLSLALIYPSLGSEVAVTKETQLDPKFWNSWTSYAQNMRFYASSSLYSSPWGLWGGASSSFSLNISSRYAAAFIPGWTWYAKAVEGDSISRRAISLDNDQLYRRDTEAATCKNAKKEIHQFQKVHCYQAAQKLLQNGLSDASCSSCKLSVLAAGDKVVLKDMPEKLLNRAIEGMLDACSKDAPVTHRKRADTKAQPKGVAVFLAAGEGKDC